MPQREATARLQAWLAKERFRAAVLYGFTGSRKTAVYLRAAESCLAAGRPVLFFSSRRSG